MSVEVILHCGQCAGEDVIDTYTLPGKDSIKNISPGLIEFETPVPDRKEKKTIIFSGVFSIVF